jgi:hypothetical protein
MAKIANITSKQGITYGIDLENGYAPIEQAVTRYYADITRNGKTFQEEVYPCGCGGFKVVNMEAWGNSSECLTCGNYNFSAIAD